MWPYLPCICSSLNTEQWIYRRLMKITGELGVIALLTPGKRLFGIPDQVKGVRPPLPPLDRSNSSVPETCLPASQSSAPRRALQNRYKSSVSLLGLPHNQGPRLGGLNPGQEGGRLEARCQQGHTPSKDPGGIASINVTSSNDPTWSLICESTAQNRELYFHMAISLYAPLGPNLPPLSFTEQAGI